MSFKRIEVNKFAGFNSSVAPELLDDGMARDIMNFRMEKIGKLVTRNGYTFGLFSSGSLSQNASHGYGRATQQPFASFTNNNGIVGIGEMVFSSKWKEIDTDRVMVYAVRCEAVPPGEDWITDKNEHLVNNLDLTGQKYSLMGYLFSPMSGLYKNQLLFNWQLLGQTTESTLTGAADDSFHYSIDGRPQGKMRDNNGSVEFESSRRLFAPHRFIEPETLTDKAGKHLFGRFDAWINYYVDMTQYRHQLIISDKINGDTLIEDEANRGLNSSDATAKKHSLHIRPNCLDEFDIDDVIIDLRSRTGQENDAPENGMALYKFKLPKMTQMTSTNLCDGSFSNLDNYPPQADKYSARLGLRQSKAFLRVLEEVYHDEGWDNDYIVTQAFVNKDDTQIFTNADNNSEVDDILGDLEYDEQEYTNDDGEVVKDLISDVYIWEDYRIPYYLCSGKEQGFTFYRELDRIFTKTTNAPRIQELTVKDENGKRVPLGVWRYRFVWDYGEGVYSAPSAELTVPDLLWSAVNDADGLGNAVDYQRPVKHDLKADYLSSGVSQYGNVIVDRYTLFRRNLLPSIAVSTLNSSMRLTALGKRLFDLKSKLYALTQHRFGVKLSAGYAPDGRVYTLDAAAAQYWDELDYADFATQVIANSGNEIQLKGIIFEGLLMRSHGGLVDLFPDLTSAPTNYKYGSDGLAFRSGTTGYAFGLVVKLPDGTYVHPLQQLDSEVKYRVSGQGYLVIPIFPGSDHKTHYSVVDTEGRLRYTYINMLANPENLAIRHQFILPGTSPLFNYNDGIESNGWRAASGIQYGFDSNGYLINRELLASGYYALWTEILTASANVYSDAVFNSNGNLYYNLIPVQQFTSQPDEEIYENFANKIINYETYKHTRPHTTLRFSNNERDTFVRTAGGTNSQAASRLILRGILEHQVLAPEEEVGLSCEYQIGDTTPNGNLTLRTSYLLEHRQEAMKYTAAPCVLPVNSSGDIDELFLHHRGFLSALRGTVVNKGWNIGSTSKVTPWPWESSRINNNKFNKLDIRLYIPATRFIGVEQLTSYFPSSLLFGAPRLGIKIDAADVPTRAKRLLVYRTIATHNNDWDPMSFGLVEKITIDRDETGQAQTLGEDGNLEYQGIYFFDDVKDKSLDFTDNPNNYDGLRRALFSRFNISINERVYYANFTEVYQSLAPRGVKLRVAADTNTALITNYAVFNDADKGFDADETYDYCYVYENEADQLSKPKYIDNVVVTPDVANGKKSVVVLYWLPSKYDDTIKELKIYRKDVASGKYHYIGSSKPEDEGIFVDDNKRLGAVLGSINPDVQHYEDGVRWSEPFQPDWIKLNSFAEYRSGDNKGARITGVESLEGNLVIFKENSIHRVAVQAEDPPLSRTDEVSQEVGCIAPNTLINVNGVLYFLSNRGFMSYDNNRLMAADGSFGEELQYIIQNLHDMDEAGRKVPDKRLYADYLREASCGYNQYYNEIYLNIPQIPAKLFETELIAGKNLVPGLHISHTTKLHTDFQRKEYYGDKLIKETPTGQEVYEEHMRDILGHIYVINPEKQYVTKFSYQGTLNLGDTEQWDIRMIDGLQNVRLYYSNSLGEMRSADIIPKQHGHPMTDAAPSTDKINWAGFYIETPYLSLKPRTHIVYDTTAQTYSGYTTLQDDTHVDHDHVFDASANRALLNTGLALGTSMFPKYKWAPIEAEWRSKFFTGDSETLLKRVRSVVMNVFSKGGIQARGLSFHREGYDDRIEYDSSELSIAVQTFQYSPTNTNVDYNTGVVTVGTNDNVLSFVPRSPYDGQLDEYDDRYGKPIRFAVDIRTNRRAQINSVVLHWRPIHTYLR